jgi:hypothetical protein
MIVRACAQRPSDTPNGKYMLTRSSVNAHCCIPTSRDRLYSTIAQPYQARQFYYFV